MRLFALPDGVIDRKDRAQWLTVPFDLSWVSVPVNQTLPTLTINSDGTWSGTVGGWSNEPTSYAWELRQVSDDSVVASGTGEDPAGSGLEFGSYYLWVEATNGAGSASAESAAAYYTEPVVCKAGSLAAAVGDTEVSLGWRPKMVFFWSLLNELGSTVVGYPDPPTADTADWKLHAALVDDGDNGQTFPTSYTTAGDNRQSVVWLVHRPGVLGGQFRLEGNWRTQEPGVYHSVQTGPWGDYDYANRLPVKAYLPYDATAEAIRETVEEMLYQASHVRHEVRIQEDSAAVLSAGPFVRLEVFRPGSGDFPDLDPPTAVEISGTLGSPVWHKTVTERQALVDNTGLEDYRTGPAGACAIEDDGSNVLFFQGIWQAEILANAGLVNETRGPWTMAAIPFATAEITDDGFTLNYSALPRAHDVLYWAVGGTEIEVAAETREIEARANWPAFSAADGNPYTQEIEAGFAPDASLILGALGGQPFLSVATRETMDLNPLGTLTQYATDWRGYPGSGPPTNQFSLRGIHHHEDFQLFPGIGPSQNSYSSGGDNDYGRRPDWLVAGAVYANDSGWMWQEWGGWPSAGQLSGWNEHLYYGWKSGGARGSATFTGSGLALRWEGKAGPYHVRPLGYCLRREGRISDPTGIWLYARPASVWYDLASPTPAMRRTYHAICLKGGGWKMAAVTPQMDTGGKQPAGMLLLSSGRPVFPPWGPTLVRDNSRHDEADGFRGFVELANKPPEVPAKGFTEDYSYRSDRGRTEPGFYLGATDFTNQVCSAALGPGRRWLLATGFMSGVGPGDIVESEAIYVTPRVPAIGQYGGTVGPANQRSAVTAASTAGITIERLDQFDFLTHAVALLLLAEPPPPPPPPADRGNAQSNLMPLWYLATLQKKPRIPVPITAAVNLNLPAVDVESPVQLGVSTTYALATPYLRLAAEGEVAPPNLSDVTLPALQLAATGQLGMQATVQVGLPLLGFTASGTMLLANGTAPHGGQSAVGLADLYLDAWGRVGTTGTCHLTVPAVSLASSGIVPEVFTGLAYLRLAPLQFYASYTGTTLRSGSAAWNLQLVMASDGLLGVDSGGLGVGMPGVGMAAEGLVTAPGYHGTCELVLPGVGMDASAEGAQADYKAEAGQMYRQPGSSREYTQRPGGNWTTG